MLGFEPISSDSISSITNSLDGGSSGGGGDDGNGSGIPIRVLIQRGKK